MELPTTANICLNMMTIFDYSFSAIFTVFTNKQQNKYPLEGDYRCGNLYKFKN